MELVRRLVNLAEVLDLPVGVDQIAQHAPLAQGVDIVVVLVCFVLELANIVRSQPAVVLVGRPQDQQVVVTVVVFAVVPLARKELGIDPVILQDRVEQQGNALDGVVACVTTKALIQLLVIVVIGFCRFLDDDVGDNALFRGDRLYFLDVIETGEKDLAARRFVGHDHL